MLVTCVKFVNLCSRVTRWHEQKHYFSKLPWMANHPTNRRGRPTPEGMQQNSHHFCLRV